MNGMEIAAEFPGIASHGDSVVLFGIPSGKSAKQQLSGSLDEILHGIASILNGMIASAIERKTASEFRSLYAEAFPTYVQLISSLSGIIRATVPRSVIESVVSESYCEIEREIEEHGRAFFGEEMKDQAMFTVWTLRKIDDLANVVMSGKVPGGDPDRDRHYASDFLSTALWARFNIDCLLMAMHTRKMVYPEVVSAISDGLRSAVNAYAWIKQAADMRRPPAEPDFVFAMDDEDKQLLSESLYDMDNEAA